MSNKKIIILSVSFFVAVIIILGVLNFINKPNTIQNNSENITNVENELDLELTGDEYIPSNVYNENNTKVSIADFADKPMALLFFNTSDITACEALKLLGANYENYKEEINFVAISVIDGVTETKQDIFEYVQSNNITIPVLYDTEYSAKNEYEISTIPTFVFINKNNEIINTISSDINQDVIEANLDILAENY